MNQRLRLSSPLSELPTRCDVVVIGSGYGGAIAASRAARAGQHVCVLERGREHPSGSFPNRLDQGKDELQIDSPHGHIGRESGLYDFRAAGDMMAFVGCGLGGTSLVNANVAVRPDPRLFQEGRFPSELQSDTDGAFERELELGFRRAEDMLRVTPYPRTAPHLPKLEALEASANRLGLPMWRPPLAVSFDAHQADHGVDQQACVGCGDCVSGCNYRAKNTVDRNYLPDAYAHGAQIFTEISVRAIAPATSSGTSSAGGKTSGWYVYFQVTEAGRESFAAPELFIHADVVILAAGTLGSSEILLRSRQRGLSLSSRLGRGFSGNGDVLAFAYNADQEVRGIGLGDQAPNLARPVGPCITGIIDHREGPVRDGLIIEEGAIPGLLSPILPQLFKTLSLIDGEDTDQGIGDRASEWLRIIESRLRGAYHGAMRNTQTFLVMSHDSNIGGNRSYDDGGILELEDDRVRVRWPEVGERPIFARIDDVLRRASAAVGATYDRNPLWSDLLGKKLITVHPLGGCGIGRNAREGVVDHKNRVFSGSTGTDVHPGLYVCDGAVLPHSIGINPFMTISALAERALAHMARDRDWHIDYDAPGHRRVPVHEEQRPGLRFTERMSGHYIDSRKRDRTTLSFVATIMIADLPKMLAEPSHGARLMATVEAPALSRAPLSATDGHFYLLYRDPTQPNARRMRYEMTLRSEEGDTFFFLGTKQVQGHDGSHAWADTTQMSYTVFAGADASGRIVGSGEVRIANQDMLRQLRTMQVTGLERDASDGGPQDGGDIDRQRRHHLLSFLRFFGQSLVDVYLGDKPQVATSLASPTPQSSRSQHRDITAPTRSDKAPIMRTVARNIPRQIPLHTHAGVRDADVSTHHFSTADGLGLSMQRFTRDTGSRANEDAVLLIHGLTTSSDMFIMPEHENLVNYLLDYGYGDVWTLDFRMSNRHPFNLWPHQHNLDDIALYDYPPAIELMRRQSGAKRIHVIAHCLGSVSFAMSLFSGVVDDIHSVIFNSASLRVNVPTWSRIKLWTGPFFIERLVGEPYISPQWADAPWHTRRGLVARAASLLHRENDIGSCHMLSLMWGAGYPAVYAQENLAPITHRRGGDLYGGTAVNYYRHVRKMVESGRRAVKFAPSDSKYAPLLDDYLSRAADVEVPCLFMTGSKNRIFVDSNILTHATLERVAPGRHELQIFDGYGHQDVFMGKHVARDIFPRLSKFLDDKRRLSRAQLSAA